MRMVEPYHDELTRVSADKKWECPACLHDMGPKENGSHRCPNCRREIVCETSIQFVCKTRLKEVPAL